MKEAKIEKIIFIGILYLILFSIFTAWAFSYDNWELKEHLKWISPLFLEINFFLILVGIVLNIDLFKQIGGRITKKTWAVVLLIAVGGTLIAMFLAPRTHRIFYDEDIYLNVGQNIAHLKKAGMCNEGGYLYGEYFCNQLEYNKDPNGWPYLVSLLFRIVGPSHLACFLMNNFIWGLSILVVFFTGFLLFEDERAGLYGALLFALIPEGLRWSNTTAVEPSAAFFAGLAVLSMLFLTKRPGARPLFLTSVIIPFAFQFRPECFLILLPIGFILVLMAPEELKKERTYVLILLLLALALPHIIHLCAVKGEAWGAPRGTKFALRYLEDNFRVNFFFYVKNRRFPLLFSLFFFLGIAAPRFKIITRRKRIKPKIDSFIWGEKTILLLWFLSFWGIFLIFYAGSYNFGADVRFSLMSYIPLAALAGFGASFLSKWAGERVGWRWIDSCLIILVLIWFLSFSPYVRAVTQEAWGARADHRYARIMAERLPPHSLVLTHNPNMFLLWGKNAAQASLATHEGGHMNHLFNRYRGGIYFHYNFWCNVSDPSQQSFCKNILKRYKTTKVVSFQEQNHEYALYKLERKKFTSSEGRH